MNKAKKTAHIGLATVILGLLIIMIVPSMYWISMAFWLSALVLGITALVFNGRAFPNTDQVIGLDQSGLDILGYIEVYVALVPTIVAVAMIIYTAILKRGM